jgi:hypothetical protein
MEIQVNTKQDNSVSRISLIKEIKTPLAFFVLVVLVTEGILGFLASKATGIDFTILVIGMIITLFALIGVVAYLANKSQKQFTDHETIKIIDFRHDVFISSPMAAIQNDEKYKENRKDVKKIAEVFHKECKFKSVFFAGQEIESLKDFEAPNISAADDIQELRASKYFVLHYPEKIVSSVLFEAGVALELGIPSLYFVKDRNHLPFLMQQAEMAFTNVKIYEFNTTEDIEAIFKNHGERVFFFHPENTN